MPILDHNAESDFSHTIVRRNVTIYQSQLHTTVATEVDLPGHCDHGALTGPLGLLVQGLLAVIAFSALIVKRFCEPKSERRPWKIWFFDTSKQAIGAAVIHFANVFLAEIFHGDPCTWYIISFLLDSTVGLLIIYIGLKISQCIARKKNWHSLLFGEYGNPPQCNAWVGQCGVYILVILIEKIAMTLLVLFDFWKKVRTFVMTPIKSPQLELIIVMFIVPFIVNAFIFWVVDNFLKKQIRAPSPSRLINSNESAMKYFKAVDKVKYYKKVGTESDVLLSAEDEDLHEAHTVVIDCDDEKCSRVGNGSALEQYRLLSTSSA